MSEECIFCRIIRKESSASIVYEDEKVIAFLSIRPVNPGHTLVVPKKHYVDVYDIPEEDMGYLFRTVKRVTHAVRDSTGAEGVRIVQNNGEVAGQMIFHLHVHIIPMRPHNQFSHDGAYRDLNGSREEKLLEEDAKKIRQAINR